MDRFSAGDGGSIRMYSKSQIDSKSDQRIYSNHIDPQILTLDETANILRVHRSTVSRYAISGELRSYLLGNRRLFKVEDVWAFFENQVDRRCVFGKEERYGNSDHPKTQS